MTRASRRAAAIAIVTWCGLLSASGQSLFEKLVTPGDVAAVHAKLEKNCSNCHEPFSKSSQRRLCLECHKEIAGDIAQKAGYHGKRAEIATLECKTCHTDHKGRDFDIVQFDRETFNHDFTDFVLKGAHRTKAQCGGCHASGEKFRKASHACVGCHKADDVHKGQLGDKCSSCHSEETWKKQSAFDHSKTAFALTGAHVKVQCAACHVGQKYKDVPLACVGCHQSNDVHRGRFGEKCATCHVTSKWTTVSFNHGKSTKFPLRGTHAAAKCNACHTGDLYGQKLQTSCISCHKQKDVHRGQLGERCERCHNEKGWRQKVDFDHDLTRFPLVGLHAAVPCEECHRSQAYRETPTACQKCHEDTHHQARLGPDCQLCHNPNGWKLWRFDHDRQTKYPLTGAHAGIACHACHSKPASGAVTAPTACFECHSRDDAHRGAFGRSCEKCHGTTSFRAGIRAR